MDLKIFLSILFLFPLFGSMSVLIKLITQEFKIKKNSDFKVNKLKVTGILTFVLIGLYIGLFLIWYIWFPYIRLPLFVKIFSFILAAPYLLGVIGMGVALGKATEFGGSSTKMTSHVSESIKDKKITKILKRNEKDIQPTPGTATIKKEIAPKGKYREAWNRKSEDEIVEIKKQLRRSSFNLTMPIAVLIITFITIGSVTSKYNMAFEYALLIPFSSFFIVLIMQLIKGKSLIGKSKSSICNQCYREDNLGLNKCNCGGSYEPKEFYYKGHNDSIT